jgi:hypothetical protein
MARQAELELTCRILLEAPPAGVDYALQKGRGSVYETVQTQRSRGKDLIFEFTVQVRNATSDTALDFAGPYVQGPRGQRFVYLDIGTYAGQTDTPWSRRLKIPLTGIPSAALRPASGVLEARVPGTGRDGSPTCATVKPFDGWELVRAKRQ